MSRVAEMRGLTEEMMRSHEERLVGITSRRADVREDLRETRQRMSSVHIARQEAAGALHQSLAKAAVDLRADTQSTLREIHAERTASASALRAELRQNRDDLSLRTHQLMEETRQARVNMAKDQRSSLEKDRAELVAEMAGFLGEIATARAVMSTSQREELHAGLMALRAEVATTRAEFREGRKAFTDDLAEFGRVWRGFTEVMRARRGGIVTEPSFQREPSAAPERGRKPSAGLSGADEAAMTPDGAATYESNSVPSDEAVFDYLADYPDGLRLVEFEEHFKAQRIRLAPILNRLIQENKARKDVEHKRYFAT